MSWKILRIIIAAVAVLSLAAALVVNYGNSQWHWRLYAHQARNADPQRLEPGPGYTGEWNNWDQDGRLVSTYQYRNGQLDGRYVLYDENGKIIADYQYKNGQRDGEFVTYDEGQKIKTTGRYNNGEFDGPLEMLRDDGGRTVIEFVNGLYHGTETTWYPNGEMMLQAQYVNGVQEGALTEYADDGALLSVTPFYNGKREGIAQIFNPDKSKRWTGTYANDMLNGTCTFFRPDGSIEYVRNFLNDVMNGVQTEFYPDGTTKMKEFGIINDNIFHGVYREWDETGKLVTDEVYENGILKQRDGKEVGPLGETALPPVETAQPLEGAAE